jgi:hypothetical protein
MANQPKRVRVATLAGALAAGFVPDGASLRNPKTGSAIDLDEFRVIAGMHLSGVTTDNEDHPIVLNGRTILAKGLVTQEVKQIDGSQSKSKWFRYEDGSIESPNGFVLTKDEVKELLSNDKK